MHGCAEGGAHEQGDSYDLVNAVRALGGKSRSSRSVLILEEDDARNPNVGFRVCYPIR